MQERYLELLNAALGPTAGRCEFVVSFRELCKPLTGLLSIALGDGSQCLILGLKTVKA